MNLHFHTSLSDNNWKAVWEKSAQPLIMEWQQAPLLQNQIQASYPESSTRPWEQWPMPWEACLCLLWTHTDLWPSEETRIQGTDTCFKVEKKKKPNKPRTILCMNIWTSQKRGNLEYPASFSTIGSLKGETLDCWTTGPNPFRQSRSPKVPGGSKQGLSASGSHWLWSMSTSTIQKTSRSMPTDSSVGEATQDGGGWVYR